MKTRSHEMGSDKPCSGCAEHAKYLKHRPVSAACWFMTPVRVCASKSEAELLEQKIERAINPVLNRMARKFPIEQNYEMLERKQNLKRRAETKKRTERKWEDSYATFGQKKSTMISALKKVDYFASDNSERMVSAIHKLREFKNLDYPNDMRREVCEILMQESGSVVWRIVGALQAQI